MDCYTESNDDIPSFPSIPNFVPPLFVHDALMAEEVQVAVIGRIPKSVPAVALGLCRRMPQWRSMPLLQRLNNEDYKLWCPNNSSNSSSSSSTSCGSCGRTRKDSVDSLERQDVQMDDYSQEDVPIVSTSCPGQRYSDDDRGFGLQAFRRARRHSSGAVTRHVRSEVDEAEVRSPVTGLTSGLEQPSPEPPVCTAAPVNLAAGFDEQQATRRSGSEEICAEFRCPGKLLIDLTLDEMEILRLFEHDGYQALEEVLVEPPRPSDVPIFSHRRDSFYEEQAEGKDEEEDLDWGRRVAVAFVFPSTQWEKLGPILEAVGSGGEYWDFLEFRKEQLERFVNNVMKWREALIR